MSKQKEQETMKDGIVDIKPGEPPAVDTEALAAIDGNAALAEPVARVQMGNFDLGDDASLPLERVHLAYAVSKTKPKGAQQGEFYLGKDWNVKLAPVDGSFEIVVIGVRTFYKEWPREYTGQAPRRFATEQEAIDAGLTVEWSGPSDHRVAPTAAKACDVMCLVRKPQSIPDGNEFFSLPLGGEYWAPAIVTFDRTTFKDAQTMFTRVLAADKFRHGAKDAKYVPTLSHVMFVVSAPERVTARGTPIPHLTIKTMVKDGLCVTPSPEFVKDLGEFMKQKTVETPKDEE